MTLALLRDRFTVVSYISVAISSRINMCCKIGLGDFVTRSANARRNSGREEERERRRLDEIVKAVK